MRDSDHGKVTAVCGHRVKPKHLFLDHQGDAVIGYCHDCWVKAGAYRRMPRKPISVA